MNFLSAFARPDDNLFATITPTSTVAPSTSYSLATFLTLNPAARVRFGATGLTLTWTLGASFLADTFVLAMSNLSGATVTLTNGSGLSQAIVVPVKASTVAMPATSVTDLKVGTPLAATRTASVWNLVIAGNAANVILGAAIALYARREFDQGLSIQYDEIETAAVIEKQNEYLVRYRQIYETFERTYDVTTPVKQSQIPAMRDWWRANNGSGRTSLLWPNMSVNDALLGSWQKTLTVSHIEQDHCQIHLTFAELTKGKPL